jgi:4-amino-4-deoxy-L-arabinose transferase-like glycosyltransferase
MSKSYRKHKNKVQHNTGSLDKSELLIIVGIVMLALFVRLFYLYESSVNPSFTTPTVDSRTYDKLARSVAEGNEMNYEFFWQPFFYPAFLSVIYLASNSSIVFAKIVQVLLGCVTCLLTYRLGKRIFDRPAGITAGVVSRWMGSIVVRRSHLAFY